MLCKDAFRSASPAVLQGNTLLPEHTSADVFCRPKPTLFHLSFLFVLRTESFCEFLIAGADIYTVNTDKAIHFFPRHFLGCKKIHLPRFYLISSPGCMAGLGGD